MQSQPLSTYAKKKEACCRKWMHHLLLLLVLVVDGSLWDIAQKSNAL